MGFPQPGIRLTISKKTEPNAPENFETIERWANTHVVNRIVDGDGNGFPSQPIGTGLGAQGTGIVTIGAGNSDLAGNDGASSDATNTHYFPDWSEADSNGTDIEFDPMYPTAFIKVLTTGIYSINFSVNALLTATTAFYGFNSLNIRTAATPGAGSDLDTDPLLIQQPFYLPASSSEPVFMAFWSTLRLIAGDSFSCRFDNTSTGTGTCEVNDEGVSSFLVRKII